MNFFSYPIEIAAAAESPPPIIVVAPFKLANVSQIAFVPTANFSTSNTPAGPFQTTVLAPSSSFANNALVLGPQSKPCSSGLISFTEATLVSALEIAPKKSAAQSSSETVTVTTSTGKIILPFAFSSKPFA